MVPRGSPTPVQPSTTSQGSWNLPFSTSIVPALNNKLKLSLMFQAVSNSQPSDSLVPPLLMMVLELDLLLLMMRSLVAIMNAVDA